MSDDQASDSKVLLSVPEGAAVKAVKQRCAVCGFMVNPVGHDLRCNVSGHSGGVSSEAMSVLRRRAWLGDVQHIMDLRVMLVCSGIPDKELAVVESRLKSRDVQAQFWSEYSGPKEEAPGSSSHSLSTAFEASYAGVFRHTYLCKTASLYLEEPVLSQVVKKLMHSSVFDV